jgi:SAM-dependent methyltransferase
MSSNHICPNCGAVDLSVFYELQGVPVHSVLLLQTREEALNYPKGDIALAFCETCGFITNAAFDPSLHEYSTGYEATQAFSPTFNEFHLNLANRLVEQHNLRGKEIIEIGCGQGEFLTLLCDLGGNCGIGFDPAYLEGSSTSPDVKIIKDFYSEKYSEIHADFICCKMTLEHIHQTAEFIKMIRRSVGDQRDSIVFFQVPDVTRILKECAFWDIYYEHSSYFCPGSLLYLFQNNGFEVIKLSNDYANQYLMIEARPINEINAGLNIIKGIEEFGEEIKISSRSFPERINYWRSYIDANKLKGKKVIVWGAGSKGVAFLSSLHIYTDIEFAVDINPNKEGTYMAGTGQRIVSPGFLRDYEPDIVLLMNPIYQTEVEQKLQSLGLYVEIIAVK